MGLILFGLNITILITTIVFPVIGVFGNLDPMYFMYKPPKSLLQRLFLLLARFVFSSWAVLEGSRIYAVFLTFQLDTTVYNLRILEKSMSESNLNESLDVYRNFQVIVESGRAGLRRTNAVLVLDGCILMIVLNYLILKCYGLMPLPLLICTIIFDAVIALIFHASLPVGIDMYEGTAEMIERGWLFELLKIRPKITWYKFKEIRKRIRSQRPVTWYYGISIFERSTRENIYRNILDQTISLILM